MTWEDMNEVYEQRYGHPMQRIANWFHKDVMPYARGSSIEEQKAIEKAKREKMRVGVPKGRIKERRGVDVPLFLNSIERDVFEAINYAARYAGLEMPTYQAKKLLIAPDFVQALNEAYGERTRRYLLNGIRDVIAEVESLGAVEQFFANTRGMMQIGYLALNPFSAMKIFMGFANATVYVNPDHMARGYAEYIAHPIRTDNTLKALSPYYRDRVERGFTRDIAEALRTHQEGKLVGARRKIGEKGMLTIQFSDRAAVAPTMHGAVLQALDDFERGELSEGTRIGIGNRVKGKDLKRMSPAEKIELAYRFADFVSTRTQDQRLPEYRSALNRASAMPGFVKFLTMWGSNTNTNLNVIRRAVNEFVFSKRDRKAVGRLTGALFLMLVVVPLSTAFVNAMRNFIFKRHKDDKDKILSFLSDYVRDISGLLYFVRDIADVAIGLIQGRVRDFTIPPIRIVNDAIRMAQRGVSWATERNSIRREDKMWRFLDSAADFVFMVGKIPLLMPKRYMQELLKRIKER